MKKSEQLLNLFKEKGILSVREGAQAGIPSVYFCRLCEKGLIERIGCGVYSCANYDSTEYMTHAEAAAVVPRGVICLFSALRYHNLTLENPHKLHLALPRGDRVPRHQLPIAFYHFSPEAYAFGIEEVKTNDGVVKVYSIEKTIADCFKFRNVIGSDVAVAALKDAKIKGLINQDKLWQALKICRVSRIARPYLEGVYA